MVGGRLVPGRARPMSKVCGVAGNLNGLTAQVVGAAGSVFAGRGQRAWVTVLECSPWLRGVTAFSGGGICRPLPRLEGTSPVGVGPVGEHAGRTSSVTLAGPSDV